MCFLVVISLRFQIKHCMYFLCQNLLLKLLSLVKTVGFSSLHNISLNAPTLLGDGILVPFSNCLVRLSLCKVNPAQLMRLKQCAGVKLSIRWATRQISLSSKDFCVNKKVNKCYFTAEVLKLVVVFNP